MSRALVFIFIVVTVSGIAASPAPEFDAPSVVWNQPAPHSPDAAACVVALGAVASRGVAVGPDQNPVFVGDIAGTSTTVVVAKYDRRSGERIWCRAFQVRAAAANGDVFAVALAKVGGVAIDAAGTIFIAGDGASTPFPAPPSSPGPAAPAPVNRYFVTRCSPSGACASVVSFINPPITGSHTESVGGIAVGPDGNPVLTGVATLRSAPPRGDVFKLLTVKVSGSTFALIGEMESDSSAPRGTSRERVAVDWANDIVVTGTEAATSKYDPLLSRPALWTRRVAGNAIAFTADEVALAGTVVDSATTGRSVAVTMLDGATGETAWTRTYAVGIDDVAREIAADEDGDVVIAEDSSDAAGPPALMVQREVLVSLNQSGQVNWAATVPSSGGDHSVAGVAVDSDGAPVVSMDSQVIQFGVHERPQGQGRGDDNDDDATDAIQHGWLAWDQLKGESITGFLVCVDAQSPSACQDVGKPIGRVIRTTTSASLTYRIALASLTSLKSGRHTLSVIAMNGTLQSPASAGLVFEFSPRGHAGGPKDRDSD